MGPEGQNYWDAVLYDLIIVSSKSVMIIGHLNLMQAVSHSLQTEHGDAPMHFFHPYFCAPPTPPPTAVPASWQTSQCNRYDCRRGLAWRHGNVMAVKSWLRRHPIRAVTLTRGAFVPTQLLERVERSSSGSRTEGSCSTTAAKLRDHSTALLEAPRTGAGSSCVET